MHVRCPVCRHYSWQDQQFVSSYPAGRRDIHIQVESFGSMPDSDNVDARYSPVRALLLGRPAYNTDILHQP